jgi:peroxiredoxin
MVKYRALVIILILISVSCKKLSDTSAITGNTGNPNQQDSILFHNGIIGDDYYAIISKSSKVENGRFTLSKDDLYYPHLYFASFKSEEGEILFREEEYYLDSSTTSVNTGVNEDCKNIIGPTHLEYTEEFKPFIFGNKYNCKKDNLTFFKLQNGIEFDKKLHEYTIKNPDSYVALWNLIERFNSNGYLKKYEEILISFSNEIKSGTLWKILAKKINSTKIRIDEKFPPISFQNEKLEFENLELPEDKYILVYYWFSKCQPCIKSFPRLKMLHSAYYDTDKFEILAISVDKTENIKLWKQKIQEYNLDWVHYLDQNGLQSQKDQIKFYPTNFLIDRSGIVLEKNISFTRLESFLEKNIQQ